VETLLKGVATSLPTGCAFRDKDGHERHQARLKWWLDGSQSTWRSIAFVPGETAEQLPGTPVSVSICPGYHASEPPVFIGHYWLSGQPVPLAANVACLDYSVVRPGGRLVAYRWDSERKLRPDQYVAVDREPVLQGEP
jgi:hypothetical protein